MSDAPDLGRLFGGQAAAATFLGLAHQADLAALTAPAAILGVPCVTPYDGIGAYCRNAPAALRAAAAPFAANIDNHDFDMGGRLFPDGRYPVDCGDMVFDATDTAGNRAAVSAAVATICGAGAVPVVIGGDDSIPIPMLQGLCVAAPERPLTILQIDAHIDWRDSHLGEAWGLSSTMRRASQMDRVDRIVQVGARGLGTATEADVAAAQDWGARIVTAEAFHRDGPAAVLAQIPDGADIAICIDADALDPGIVPGVIARSPGGLSYLQVRDLIFGAADRGRVAAMSFVEFMPERDVDGLGALTIARLITSGLGVAVRSALATGR